MAGRRIRDEAEALACLAAVKQGGESHGAWARAHGVDGRSLQAWRMTLARRGRGRGRDLPFVELVADERVVRAAARYTIRVGGLAVDVDEGFDERTLQRLLSVMSAC